MKSFIRGLLIGSAVGVLLAAVQASAQVEPPPPGEEAPWMMEPEPPPHGEPGGDEMDRPRGPPMVERGEPGEGRGNKKQGFVPGEIVDRYLGRLRERNPEEFDRLMELRKQDPIAFRGELQKKLLQERMRKIGEERPAIVEAIKSLPQADRDWLMGRLMMPQGPGEGRMMPPREGGGPGGREPDRKAMMESENKLREKAQAFRNAATDEERNTLKEDLRKELAAVFDLKAGARKEELARLEAQVSKFKETLEKRNQNRDAIIDKRLKELTEGDALAW